MKKLTAVILILVLILPAIAVADPDPIVGAWYIMLDYTQYPSPDAVGKEYMFYIMVFEEDGTISCVSAESTQDSGLTASGGTMGAWVNNGDNKYIISVLGIGTNKGELEGDRLFFQVTGNVWYSMQRMNMGDWYKDMVIRY